MTCANRRRRATLGFTNGLLLMGTPAIAADPIHAYHIRAQALGPALREAGRLAGRDVMFPADAVAGKRSPALDGNFDDATALQRLLAGTGLEAVEEAGAILIRGRSDAAGAPLAQDTSIGTDVLVTGSRIRGAPIASPVISLSSKAIRDAGQSNLGDVVRSIPQSFGGGQNPGVGLNVPATSGVNVGGGSSINLRGLGSDATLTLLNGHRLTYTGSRQGVDVSSIPLAAVDRIEIVADGASALYGSDAVAGVANIILKRDHSGLEARARFGPASQGDYSEQQYDAVAGSRWRGGGIMAAYEYASNPRIQSDDRSFASVRPGVTIYPAQRRHALILAGHQALSDALTFEVDALYNKRWNITGYPQNTAGDLTVSRVEQDAVTQSWAVSPSLKLNLASSWHLSLSGTYGEETSNTDIYSYVGINRSTAFICYCNRGKSVELAADGALFRLPGGPVQIALGAGYRDNQLNAFRGAGNIQNFNRSQDSGYGYGELSVPLASPDQNIRFVHQLNLSGAVRYERYPGIGAIATPKLGLIYAPSADLDFRGSWGKAFRAPTLLQQYQVRSASLSRASSLGGTGYPASATALILLGGNPDVKPERATTWTATLALHPRALPRVRLELSYFSTIYKDRIVSPISYFAQALSNPLYGSLVTANPSAALQAAALASTVSFTNGAGVAYLPANVVAIIDDSNVNAGRQTAHGVDVLASYDLALRRGAGRLQIMANASYLESDQRLFPAEALTQKAGLLFNPPHWRGRGGITWDRQPITWNATVSYIGGVEDPRTTPSAHVGSMTTLDLTARYAVRDGSRWLNGLDFSVSLRNAFDTRPDTILTTSFADTAYDSTNYSPVGRLVSLEVGKKW